MPTRTTVSTGSDSGTQTLTNADAPDWRLILPPVEHWQDERLSAVVLIDRYGQASMWRCNTTDGYLYSYLTGELANSAVQEAWSDIYGSY
jgi:hypothetical protein